MFQGTVKLSSQTNPYSGITAQIWMNMKANCNLAQSFVPANNLTGKGLYVCS